MVMRADCRCYCHEGRGACGIDACCIHAGVLRWMRQIDDRASKRILILGDNDGTITKALSGTNR